MTDPGLGVCDGARLSAYRDGELEPVERQQLAVHLADCTACQAHLRDYVVLAAALCEPAHTPPMAITRAAVRTRLEAPERRPWRTRALPRVAAAGSTALAVAVALGSLSGLPWAPRSAPAVPAVGVSAAVPAQTPAPAGPDTLQSERVVAGNAAVVDDCAQPLPSLSAVLAQRPHVQGVLGCATDAARVLGVAAQGFERGSLLRRGDTRVVYMVTQDGRWRQYVESSASTTQRVSLTDLSPAPGKMQAGPAESGTWFQGVWTDRPELARLLGGAVDGSQQSQGLVQTFQGGVALWDGRGHVYVLMSTGESLQFLDQRARQRDFLQPLPIPTLEASRPTDQAAL